MANGRQRRRGITQRFVKLAVEVEGAGLLGKEGISLPLPSGN